MITDQGPVYAAAMSAGSGALEDGTSMESGIEVLSHRISSVVRFRAMLVNANVSISTGSTCCGLTETLSAAESTLGCWVWNSRVLGWKKTVQSSCSAGIIQTE